MRTVNYTVLLVRVPSTLDFFFLLPSDGCQWLVKLLGPGLFSGRPISSCLLSLKEPWRCFWLGTVPCSCSIAGSSHSVSALSFTYPSDTASVLGPPNLKSLLSAPVALGVVLSLFLLSVSPGNVWQRQDDSPQPGWFLVSRVQTKETASPQSKAWVSALWRHLRNVWAPGISFCLRRHLKPWPGPHPWTGFGWGAVFTRAL